MTTETTSIEPEIKKLAGFVHGLFQKAQSIENTDGKVIVTIPNKEIVSTNRSAFIVSKIYNLFMLQPDNAGCQLKIDTKAHESTASFYTSKYQELSISAVTKGDKTTIIFPDHTFAALKAEMTKRDFNLDEAIKNNQHSIQNKKPEIISEITLGIP